MSEQLTKEEAGTLLVGVHVLREIGWQPDPTVLNSIAWKLEQILGGTDRLPIGREDDRWSVPPNF
jgi:hypothetical protein